MAKKSKAGRQGGGLYGPDNYLSRLLHGRILSTDFLSRNWMTIFIVVAIILVYITNKYQCQTRMETIRELEHELEVADSEAVRQKSEYMSHIRESAMQELVDTLHMGLKVPEYPPYHISREK